MRGAVSLAAALALPLTTSTGQPFPHRHLIIFMTFAVILATLVGQGLSLPWLIRRLGLHRDDSETQEELRGRLRATDAALARLEELASEDWTRDDTVERMRGCTSSATGASRPRRLPGRRRRPGPLAGPSQLVHELLEAQRREIVLLRNQGQISNQVMGRIEHDLDLEDARLEIWRPLNKSRAVPRRGQANRSAAVQSFASGTTARGCGLDKLYGHRPCLSPERASLSGSSRSWPGKLRDGTARLVGQPVPGARQETTAEPSLPTNRWPLRPLLKGLVRDVMAACAPFGQGTPQPHRVSGSGGGTTGTRRRRRESAASRRPADTAASPPGRRLRARQPG